MESTPHNITVREDSTTKPATNKTRKRCKRGLWYVPSKDLCLPKEEAQRIMANEKKEERARYARIREEKKAKAKLEKMQPNPTVLPTINEQSPTFVAIQGVLKASIRDLKQVSGISEKLATNIYMSIHK